MSCETVIAYWVRENGVGGFEDKMSALNNIEQLKWIGRV